MARIQTTYSGVRLISRDGELVKNTNTTKRQTFDRASKSKPSNDESERQCGDLTEANDKAISTWLKSLTESKRVSANFTIFINLGTL